MKIHIMTIGLALILILTGCQTEQQKEQEQVKQKTQAILKKILINEDKQDADLTLGSRGQLQGSPGGDVKIPFEYMGSDGGYGEYWTRYTYTLPDGEDLTVLVSNGTERVKDYWIGDISAKDASKMYQQDVDNAKVNP